jgi:hypothetical protein
MLLCMLASVASAVCSSHATCTDCTSSGCGWCASMNACVDGNNDGSCAVWLPVELDCPYPPGARGGKSKAFLSWAVKVRAVSVVILRTRFCMYDIISICPGIACVSSALRTHEHDSASSAVCKDFLGIRVGILCALLVQLPVATRSTVIQRLGQARTPRLRSTVTVAAAPRPGRQSDSCSRKPAILKIRCKRAYWG